MSIEMVNHPSHYNQEGRKECIEEMEELFGKFETAKWALITAYKYLYRAGTKADNSFEQDMSKVDWYITYARNFKPESESQFNEIVKVFNSVKAEFDRIAASSGWAE